MEGYKRHDPAGASGLRHGVVHLPILVAHRGGRRAREIEEEVARGLLRPPSQVVDLVDAVERVVLTIPGYWPASICCFSPSPLGPPAISTNVGSQSRAANFPVVVGSHLIPSPRQRKRRYREAYCHRGTRDRRSRRF